MMKYLRLITIIIFVFLICTCGRQEEQTARELPLPRSAFHASIILKDTLSTLMPNQVTYVPVIIKNISEEKWPSLKYIGGKYIVAAAYVLLDRNGKIVKEGQRTMLPHDLQPDEEICLDVRIQAPDSIGKYRIKIEMVQEGVAWFSHFDPFGSNASFDFTVK